MAPAVFRGPRRLRHWQLRWMLNFYPPLFWQRVKVVACDADFRHVRVRVRRSLWTRNLNGSTFGGSLYAACDPIYPLMYWQALARRGLEVQAWLKAAEIDFLKPARGAVSADFRLSGADLDSAATELAARGKCVRVHEVLLIDPAGETCARASTVSFLRLLPAGERGGSAF